MTASWLRFLVLNVELFSVIRFDAFDIRYKSCSETTVKQQNKFSTNIFSSHCNYY